MRAHQEKDCMGLRFEHVDITYSNGSLFYSGWIQDLGLNSGPTIFVQNYENCGLESEEANGLDIYDELSPNPAVCSIRPATADDIEKIIDLRFQNFFDDGYNRISAFQALNQMVDATHLAWVAISGTTIVGHAYVILQPDGVAFLDDIYVHQKFRNGKLGTNLMQSANCDAMERGVSRVELKIIGHPDQCENAARFYARIGFTVLDCSQRHDGIVEAAMRLVLHR
jgi:GNAT superfamily N-acetyltransferase